MAALLRSTRYRLTHAIKHFCWLALFAASLALTACTDASVEPAAPTTADSKDRPEELNEPLPNDQPIKDTLRILIVRGQERHAYLPRSGTPVDSEVKALQRFAREQDMWSTVVVVDGFRDLIPSLLSGDGDVIAANLTVTDKRREQIAFTHPLKHAREQLVSRISDPPMSNKKKLHGREIAVRPGTSFWETVENLGSQVKTMRRRPLPDHLSNDELLDQLAAEHIDLLVMDSNALASARSYRDDIHPILDLTNARAIAWAVRKDRPELLESLNQFILEERLNAELQEIWRGDLDAIKKRKELRVALRNGPGGYYLQHGELVGFHYELAQALAKSLKLRLRIIVGKDSEEVAKILSQGRADVAADFFSKVEGDLQPTRAVYKLQPMMLTAASNDVADNLGMVTDTIVYADRESPSWKALEAKISLIQATVIRPLAPYYDAELVRAAITDGSMRYVADGQLTLLHLLDPDPDVRAAFPVGGKQPFTWLTRDDTPQLNKAISKFFRTYYRSTNYNITAKRYLSGKAKKQTAKNKSLLPGQLSPYDGLIQSTSGQFGFDWRLIAAQMYQESQFNPKARSHAGAKGLMQLMPRTARQVNVTNRDDPAQSIRGGVEYLHWLYNRFDDELPVTDRIWFALAAYNAGYGHVQDARRLAKQKGWNADRWFNHSERAIRLLSRSEYAKKARYGYVRGGETSRYVREIRNRFQAYRQIEQTTTAGKTHEPPLSMRHLNAPEPT